MINNGLALSPLLEAKKQLDNMLTALKDKMVIIHKRKEAIQTAIDVMRSSDAELSELQLETRGRPRGSGKGIPYHLDEQAIENRVLEMLQARPMRYPELLEKIAIPTTKVALKRVLQTSSKITREGERNFTFYSLKNGTGETSTTM